MKIDTDEMEHDFTVIDIDSFKLVNLREIGINIGTMFIDRDEIWLSDMIYEIQKYFEDFIDSAFDEALNYLNENGREIDVEK